MAEGVQNACECAAVNCLDAATPPLNRFSATGCVVCFMSKAYESSENCRLELQFAKQTGVPIVPVIVEAGYTAAGWLGIVTAGGLWVPLFDPSTIADGVDQLVQQVQRAVPAEALRDGAAAGAGGGGDDALFTASEMRDEVSWATTKPSAVCICHTTSSATQAHLPHKSNR